MAGAGERVSRGLRAEPRLTPAAAALLESDVPVIAAAISPFENVRQWARDLIGENFIEVYARCPLEECINRDVKGMYKKALAGEIKGFTGVDDPFDEPADADLICDTDQETPEESAAKVVTLNGKSVKTLSGQTVKVSVRGGNVFLNGSTRVTKTDVLASNGVIHVVNKVLIPKS